VSVPSPAPVAFGLTTPLRAGLGRVRHRPLRALAPVLVLLVPVVPVALAVLAVLRGGADVAMTELLAGAPDDAPGAVILRPDPFGVRMLVALAALLVVALALVAVAGLVAGAAAAGAASTGDAVRRAVRAWPATAATVVAGALAVGVAAAAVIAVALLAGRVRFQLTGVVLVLGLGALAVVLVRLSIGPAIALEDGVARPLALRQAWSRTRGSGIRLVLASVVVLLAFAVPTTVGWALIILVLDALADAEVLELSPVAIGLWALVLVPVAVVVGAVVWGVGARAVALAVRPRD
jgi:hypothetical protein